MQQHAVVIAPTDLPEPTPTLRCGVEVDFAGVWIASTWRPATAPTVPSLQLSMIRSIVTLSLPRKRLNRTSSARSPPESRRRHTSLPATMRPTSAAPLCRDDDPRTGLASSLSVTTLAPPKRSADIEITRTLDSGIPELRPESICRIRYVHALAPSRGRLVDGSRLTPPA